VRDPRCLLHLLRRRAIRRYAAGETDIQATQQILVCTHALEAVLMAAAAAAAGKRAENVLHLNPPPGTAPAAGRPDKKLMGWP
jgi:hypothetical protein